MSTPVATLLARRPLAGRYPAAVALALLALCPFIVLSTAFLLFETQVMADLGASRLAVRIADGLANAGYAFGAVVAADLIQRFSLRPVYLSCQVAFVLGSVLAAIAPGIALFDIGRTVQGVATGMLLVVALPPLVTKYGAGRLPTTAAVVDLGLFGMVTLGPMVGGVASHLHAWRELLIVLAALSVAGLVVGALSLEDDTAGSRGMGSTGRPSRWPRPPHCCRSSACPH